jgi:site-specific recombinase XerD
LVTRWKRWHANSDGTINGRLSREAAFKKAQGLIRANFGRRTMGKTLFARATAAGHRWRLLGAGKLLRLVERASAAAELGFKAHPHMLRHACGFALANKGHDTCALQAYLGHKNIQHTVRYTELSPDPFKDFWR